MESSEDDAGAAAIASRRPSARESDMQQESDGGTLAAGACGDGDPAGPDRDTPGLSEYFDGDSVPSPSQDANTSTEAILDMIDEFVDGPGAPRRLPLEACEAPAPATAADALQTPSDTDNLSQQTTCQSEPAIESETCSASEPAAITPDAVSATVEPPCAEQSVGDVDSAQTEQSDVSEPASSSVAMEVEQAPMAHEQSVSSNDIVTPSSCNTTTSTASTLDPKETVTTASTSDPVVNHEILTSERTMKCVSSTDTANVTVESAESTSSDSLVSTPITRSPLKRRLVRPAKPDTTVTSTVDVHSTAPQSENLASSESVTKAVSSSSDSIIATCEENSSDSNSNMSSLSVTSVSTPRKIKLIRSKVLQSASSAQDITEQCQSTSTTPVVTAAVPESQEPIESSSNSDSSHMPCSDDKDVKTLNENEHLQHSEGLKPSVPITNCTQVTETLDSNQIDEPTKSLDAIVKTSEDVKPKPEVIPEALIEEKNLKSNAKDSEPQSMVEDKLSKPVVEEKAIVANNEEVKTEPVLDERRVPPIKLNVSSSMVTEHLVSQQQSELTDCQESISIEPVQEVPDTLKQVPKLTIKLGNKLSDGPKSPVPKLTIKPIRPPTDAAEAMTSSNEQIPKLIIKPIVKPPEKVNDIHRKSSSSEISESEVSENDETSNSDQTSASDQGSANVIPKVTIKLGKAGTESEGIFYTEKNAHKICSKPAEDYKEEETVAKIKLKITQNQHEERIYEKIPKLTIKTMVKADSPQPVSPKLIIKPLKPPDHYSKELKVETAELPIPKLKITTESLSPREVKENSHVPKITIKAVTRSDSESSKVLKKSRDEDLDVPVVTKLNIKPIPNPAGTFGDKSDRLDDKVPVVSKLNIKPIVRPNDNDLDGNEEGVPKVTKLNIKPIKNPELIYSETKDCDDLISGSGEKSIPVVTKLNIKPIIKPIDEDMSKDSENQSSETGNSSDDNSDQIPVVTKLNIKPIVKPSTTDGQKSSEIIPIVTKLNIKPLVKPEDIGPISPKKDSHKRLEDVPVITKLNIKPILRPEEIEETKNPPLVMKINIKSMNENYSEGNKVNSNDDHIGSNNIDDKTSTIPKVTIKPIVKPPECETPVASANCMHNDVSETKSLSTQNKFTEPLSQNCVPESKSKDLSPLVQDKTILRMNDEPRRWKSKETVSHQFNCVDQSYAKKDDTLAEKLGDQTRQEALEQLSKLAQKTSTQSCTLLKKLLAEDNTKRDPEKSVLESFLGNSSVASKKPVEKCEYKSGPGLQKDHDNTIKVNSVSSSSTTDINATKPLEINTTLEKTSSSGQDSPRIILKINKTDFGTSSEIITEDMKSSEPMTAPEDKVIEKKPVIHRRNKKDLPGDLADVDVGKRLRSSRVVQDTEKAPTPRRNAGKRPHNSEEKPEENKESGISLLESKKAKLGKMLANTSLPIAPAADVTANALPAEPDAKDLRPAPRMNHTVLNNENCTNKNGSSKLHRILSNLQAKQMPQNDIKNTENSTQTPDGETTSTSSEVTDTIQCISNKMYINEGTATPIFGVAADESAEDPLDTSRSAASGPPTPAPRKRGRPRKVPLSTPVAEQTPQPPPAPAPPPAPLPVPALEERPQRSLRLSRERTPVVSKPRGRGRGRGAKRTPAPAPAAPVDTAAKHFADVAEQTERKPSPEKTEGLPSAEKIEGLPSAEKKEDIDPTSSRIKLPRMTEALESSCSTPLTSRRRSLDTVTTDLKVVLDVMPKLPEEVRSPEARRGGRGGRGRRGARTPATTPRKAGRGRGGGRGAVYMKETMGIYGRVCGPATTTVQLFEEETCMMDDNATHDKPSHLQDEDSQSSVKSCTNDSGKAKRSKFDDLFDSKRVWTAADVKEYTWPPPGTLTSDRQVMMIQEQVALFLNVRNFRRRYPELKRRAVAGDERDFVLAKAIVDETLCELGATAVDASEVLDIMLSDYPHKYEEYRSHQRVRQLAQANTSPVRNEVQDEKLERIEMKEPRPEPGKTERVDPEKLRQELAAAAIASASEFNARLNARRRTACVDLQSGVVHRPRRPPAAPRAARVRPPAGWYPLAVLPGQWRHAHSRHAPEELSCLPLNTVLRAPPPGAGAAASDSDGGWSSDEQDAEPDAEERAAERGAKRRKVAKPRRSRSESDDEAATCRACGLRAEGNRKYSHERFLSCARCGEHVHPACSALPPDTVRKCREYAWACAACKACAACRRPPGAARLLLCDLCDRGFHAPCVGLDAVPPGRWHCVECALCKSCGANDPAGLTGAGTGSTGAGSTGTPAAGTGAGTPGGDGPEWHHRTKRGPGGHKVYSHSLCTPCARAYRIGRYCPLCDRSFVGPKGTMQLVICKLCDRQLHQECVKQSVSNLNVLDYTCAECRRGGITSRAAAVRLAPRTIATLFMAKRRFNKYEYRKYMQSRMKSTDAPDAPDALDDSVSDAPPDESLDAEDPLGCGADDEAASAVKALQMDFGD